MDYAMFSDDGNQAVTRMVEQLLKLPIDTPLDTLYAALTAAMNELAQVHPEVWDTDVREHIIGRLERVTERAMTIYF